MKKGASHSDKSRKSSRWNNSYRKLLLSVLFWLSWVGGVLFLVQYMVAVIAILLIGHVENLSPAVGMICNAIADVIAVILVVMTPKWLSKLLNPRAQEIMKHRPLKERLIQIADEVGITITNMSILKTGSRIYLAGRTSDLRQLVTSFTF